MKTLKVKIEGVAPLLMHNPQAANPMNQWAKLMKSITSKRKRTDEDNILLSKYEWYSGIYTNRDGKLTIPDLVIEGAILAGAAKDKLKTAFKPAVMVTDVEKLKYEGPEDVDELFESGNNIDMRSVGVQTSRVMRTRPIFDEWSIGFHVVYDNMQVNKEQVVTAIEKAGRMCGVGDYRPKFGRFEVKDIKEL